MKRPKLKTIVDKKLDHYACVHCGVFMLGKPPIKDKEEFCYLCRQNHGVGYCDFCAKLKKSGIINECGSYM